MSGRSGAISSIAAQELQADRSAASIARRSREDEADRRRATHGSPSSRAGASSRHARPETDQPRASARHRWTRTRCDDAASRIAAGEQGHQDDQALPPARPVREFERWRARHQTAMARPIDARRASRRPRPRCASIVRGNRHRCRNGRTASASPFTTDHSTSNSPAAPMPPPTHIVTTTYFAPRRLPSISAWPVRRAPDMP